MLTVRDFIYADVWGGPKSKQARIKCACRPSWRKCPASKEIGGFLFDEKRRAKARRRARLLKQAGLGFRDRVIHAFEFTCQYCGTTGDANGYGPQLKGYPPGTRRNWTIDRIDPNGIYEPSNVTLACIECNSGKQQRKLLRSPLSLADVEGRK